MIDVSDPEFELLLLLGVLSIFYFIGNLIKLRFKSDQ